MNQVNESAALYIDHYARTSDDLTTGPDWLVAHRRAALARFANHGFPDPRQEEWKYTNVRPIANKRFEPVSRDQPAINEATVAHLAPLVFGQGDGAPALVGYRMVFVDGHFVPALSDLAELPAGLEVLPLPTVLAAGHARLADTLTTAAMFEDNSFTALNAAFIDQGAFITVKPNSRLDKPVYLLFVSTAGSERPLVFHPRIVIDVGANSEISVVEHYVGEPACMHFTNSVGEIIMAERARLVHYLLQETSDVGYHVGGMYVKQARDSVVQAYNIDLGGRLVRKDINVNLGETGASALLCGLFLTRGRQHIDNHVRVRHAAAHTESEVHYRGVADSYGRGVFKGRVLVERDCQQIQAHQNSANLLLSDHAEIDTKPELEIYADDVKCSHGATVGRLDDDSLFYLQSRGIAAEQARAILIYAFANQVTQRMDLVPLRLYLEAKLVGQLPDR